MKKTVLRYILFIMTAFMMQSVLCSAENAGSKQATVYKTINITEESIEYSNDISYEGTLYDALEYISVNKFGSGVVLRESITLSKSLTMGSLNDVSGTIIVEGDVEIDLNGHFITQIAGNHGNEYPLFLIPKGSSLKIKDSSDGKNGIINGVQYGIWVKGGELIVDDGRIMAQSGAIEGYDDCELPVKITEGGSLSMSGGTIDYNGELSDGRTYIGISGAIFADENTKILISGGNVTGDIICSDYSGVKITGGRFKDIVDEYISPEYECIPDGKMFSVQRKKPQVSGTYKGNTVDVALEEIYDEKTDRVKKYIISSQSQSGYKTDIRINITQIFSLVSELDKSRVPQVEILTDSTSVFLDEAAVWSLADSSDKCELYFISKSTNDVDEENKKILCNAKKQITYGFVDNNNNDIPINSDFNVSFMYYPENTTDIVNVYRLDEMKAISEEIEYENGVVEYKAKKVGTLLISDGYGLNILGKALDLKGNISMIYYAMPERLKIDNVKMLFWTTPQTDYTMETAERVVESSGKSVNGYKFEFKNISSKDMNKNIYARLMAVKDNGEIVYGEIPQEGYSVRKYAKNMMKNEKLKPLLVKMLNYGAATQEYFGSEDELVNSDLTDAQRATDYTKIYKSESQTITESGDYAMCSAEISGKTLLLEGDISINYYTSWENESGYDEAGMLFWTENSYNMNKRHVFGTESYKTTFFENNGDYRVFSYPNIVSCAMNEQVYARIYVRYGNEYRYSDIDSYSVRDYVANQLTKSTDKKFVNLLRTLMLYGEEAEKYFKSPML